MGSLHETRAAQKMQRRFKQLMSEHLPDELRRAISEELWIPHLLSLDLLIQIRSWHADFLNELALLVREEVVASKTILCREGHASTAAYSILQGRLAVRGNTHWQGQMPEFSNGMWVGESSFVSASCRRSYTVVAMVLTRVMAIPADGFHDLIEECGLQPNFQAYCETKLALGLCGRCGSVGDHFTHACPKASCRASWRSYGSGRRNLESADDEEASAPGGPLSLDAFLHAHRLTRLAPLLQDCNVETREDLDHFNFRNLLDRSGLDAEVRSQVQLLNALMIEREEQAALRRTEQDLSAQHFAFLSHY